MKLVLAEKPSVAMSLSKVIGADQRGDGYMEGNGYLVSWCVGHLVELSQPEAYDEKYAKWKYDDLPILPEHWQYQVSASTKKQFGILKKLMQRKDVESLICATDAGREGELIFRLVYHQYGCKKPVERLWISSMEDSAIREGFQKLRPGSEYDALYEAALCRERADWIVGINATRLFSCLYGQTMNVGRVMTPTLAMVVMRDAAIRAFKQESFYSAELKFRDFQAGGERMKKKAEAEKEETGAAGPVDFLKRYPSFVVVLLGCILIFMSHSLINSFNYQIAMAKGGGSGEMGNAMTISAVSELPTMFLFGYLLKKKSSVFWLRLSGLFFVLKSIGTFLAFNIPTYYAVQPFQMFGWALINVACVYYVDGIMEPQDSIKGQAYMAMTITAGNVMSSLFGGWLIDAAGVGAMLICASLAAFIGWLIVCLGSKEAKTA